MENEARRVGPGIGGPSRFQPVGRMLPARARTGSLVRLRRDGSLSGFPALPPARAPS